MSPDKRASGGAAGYVKLGSESLDRKKLLFLGVSTYAYRSLDF